MENLAKYFEDERNDKNDNIDLGIFTKVNTEEIPRQDIDYIVSHIPNFRIKVAWNILKMLKDEKKDEKDKRRRKGRPRKG
ncbi:hypothetical protein L1887_17800 [Cichorium endivia]|nr:hypothetical protein L1887_17800 [Cichorium endivia]